MVLTTVNFVSGHELATLGLVQGTTVQSVNALKDIGAGFKTFVGGELKSYNKMMLDARALATERMVENAQALGADAIIGIRYTTSSIMQGAAEILAYGTAVKYLS